MMASAACHRVCKVSDVNHVLLLLQYQVSQAMFLAFCSIPSGIEEDTF
jgi:hypothetical protein